MQQAPEYFCRAPAYCIEGIYSFIQVAKQRVQVIKTRTRREYSMPIFQNLSIEVYDIITASSIPFGFQTSGDKGSEADDELLLNCRAVAQTQ